MATNFSFLCKHWYWAVRFIFGIAFIFGFWWLNKEVEPSSVSYMIMLIITFACTRVWMAPKIEAKLESIATSIKEKKHDNLIIKEIIELLPFEDTRHWLLQAYSVGISKEFTKNIDKFDYLETPNHKLYNQSLDKLRVKLISSVKKFNNLTTGYLGSQENPNGLMFSPPHHLLASDDIKVRDRYTQLRELIRDEAIVVVQNLERFLTEVQDSKVLL